MSEQNYFECDICHDSFDNLKDYTEHIREMGKPVDHYKASKQESSYETPLMRDLDRVLPRYFLGFLIGLSLVLLFIWPFSLTVYGPHCMEMTDYTIPQWILRSLTIQC